MGNQSDEMKQNKGISDYVQDGLAAIKERGQTIVSKSGNKTPPPEKTQPLKGINYWQIGFAALMVMLVLMILSGRVYDITIGWLFPSGTEAGKQAVTRLGFLISFTLASFFPISAIAYLLFQRNTQLRKLAGDFWLLGIDIRGERSKYLRIPSHLEDLKPEHYATYFEHLETQTRVSWNYVIQSMLAVLATIFGLSLFAWLPESPLGKDLFRENANTIQALRFGFLGAYIYSLQLVYRRYTTLDLQPTVYINCTLTLLAGIVFNFIAFKAIESLSSDPATGLAGGLLAIVAFSLGYFPYLAIRWFNRLAHTTLGEKQRRSDDLALGLIDGISQFHEVRLRDEGIDNVQNLAAAALDDLLINTRFSAKQVVEWVDQAVLYLYLEPSDIDSFRRGGVRSYSDLEYLWGPFFDVHYVTGNPSRKILETLRRSKTTFPSLRGPKFKEFYKDMLDQWTEDSTKWTDEQSQFKKLDATWVEERKALSLQLQSTPERLDALYLAPKLGANVAHIKNYWKRAEEAQLPLQNQFKVTKKVSELFIRIGKQPLYTNGVTGEDVRHLLEERLVRMFDELEADGVWDDPETWWDDEEETIDKDNRTFFQIGKARVASQVDKLDEAIKAYRKVIEREPYREDIHSKLAQFYLDKHDKEPTQEYLDEAEKLAKQAVALTEGQDSGISLSLDSRDEAFRVLSTVKEKLAKAETDPTKKAELTKAAEEYRKKISSTGRSDGWSGSSQLEKTKLQESLQLVMDMFKQGKLVMKENGQTDLAAQNGATPPAVGNAPTVGVSVIGTQPSNGQPAPTEVPQAAAGSTSASGADTTGNESPSNGETASIVQAEAQQVAVENTSANGANAEPQHQLPDNQQTTAS